MGFDESLWDYMVIIWDFPWDLYGFYGDHVGFDESLWDYMVIIWDFPWDLYGFYGDHVGLMKVYGIIW